MIKTKSQKDTLGNERSRSNQKYNMSSHSRSRHSGRSNNSKKSGISGLSNSKYMVKGFTSTNERILFKDASK
jgi:hypothetical protein